MVKLTFFVVALLARNTSGAQVKLKGTVYDESGVFPLQAVSVICSSGKGAVSDSSGHYSIFIREKDSVWFSYLGKETMRFAVSEIFNPDDFNISLQVDIHVLKEAKVKPPAYKYDSIQNRIEYAKVFNYQKPSFKTIVEAISITGIVIDLDELIRAFQYRQKKMMLSFQNRLIEEEHLKYISHRFTKPLVSEITGLKGDALDSFMVKSRPSYYFVLGASDYSLKKYIKDFYEADKTGLAGSKKPDDQTNRQ